MADFYRKILRVLNEQKIPYAIAGAFVCTSTPGYGERRKTSTSS